MEVELSNEQKTPKTGPAFPQRLLMFSCAIFGLLVAIGGISYGLWWGVAKYVPHGILAIWALLATALIPVSVWAGVRYGQTESRGVVNGLAAGVGAVMGAANQVADVKVSTTRAMRPAAPVYPAALPEQVVIDIEPHHEGGTVYV